MYLENKLKQFYKDKNGIFKFSELLQLGLNQRQIKNLENNKIIERIRKGIYSHKDYLPDMLKAYQMENSKLIYSHETAAYIHNLTDRYPRQFSVTTESGYHLRKADELKVYYIKKELLSLGIEEVENASGNMIIVYDKERTVCDIIKSKDRIELQVYSEVIQNYFNGKVKLNKLSKYANELGVSEKVSEIVVLMMKP
ncbi:MAG: type IV toxin-antitoxin system AbiEi family antitoxin domain-containing protein [Coprobacillaceae bacterium]